MNQVQEIDDEITNEQAMLKLSYWHQQMELVQPNPEQCYREYIALYVEKQSYSEDFFIALCEHAVIQRLFGAAGKQVPSIAVLEMFNLLLANTSQLNNLVYIFSQPSLHEYLFERFNIFKENAESVEYYIQLLKTIIMKISIHKNNSLIKLFCNNRYPSFPLLTMVTLLGTSLTREVLVKVTAHQCVLLLIALINQKEVGRGYLNDLQMIVFYFEFANQMFEEEKADQEGMLKYLVDLIFALRKNFTSLSFLLNTICNVLIARNLNLKKIISFLSKLSEQIRQYSDFPIQLSHEIMSNFASIVNKIYFSSFINSTYMTTLKLVSSLRAQCQPNLLKYFNQRGEKISAYLIEFDKNPETQKQKEYAFEGWRDFNDSSQQVINIKQNKSKQKSGIFGFFMGKIDPNEQYIKVVLMTAGLNNQQIRFPLFKLSLSLNYKTALYIVEQMLSKHNPHRGTSHPHSKIQTFEIHINEYRGKFDLTLQLLNVIFRMKEKIDTKNLGLINEETSMSIKGVEFQYHFLKHLRTYLIHNLCDHLLNADKDYKISEMVLWSILLTLLQVNDYLQRKCRQKLFFRMQKLQQEIHELTFQNDFKYLIEYIIYNKERRFLMSKFTLEEDQLNCKEAVLQNRLDRKVFKYEVLRKLMDSQLPSINKFIENKWAEVISKGQYIIVHRDEKDRQIQVSATASEGFVIKLSTKQQDTVSFTLNEMDGQIEEEDSSRIYFLNYPNGIKMKSHQSALILCNEIKKMRSMKEEVITKSILQYFQTIHQTLCKKVYHKMGEKSDKIVILKAH